MSQIRSNNSSQSEQPDFEQRQNVHAAGIFPSKQRNAKIRSSLKRHSPGQQHSQLNSWKNLEDALRGDPVYTTYETMYERKVQSWRVQSHGRICIVSDAFVGLVVSAGHGTALTTLAEALSENGFDVTLLYTRGQASSETSSVDFWVQHYSKRSISLVALPEAVVTYDTPLDISISHRIYSWLARQPPFDVLHFSDIGGLAYYTLQAKQQGLHFERTTMLIHAYRPHLWYKTHSFQSLESIHDLVRDFQERQCAAMADAVISPSGYMLSWMRDQGWQLNPQKSFVHPNILPKWVTRRRSQGPLEMQPISELVFFGRMEMHKGLILFCDALDKLMSLSSHLDTLRVSFLGRVSDLDDDRLLLRGGAKVRPDDYIRHRASKWGFQWQILQDLDVQSRIDYMRSGPRLAVLSYLMENAPYTLVECLVAGVPFLATDVGGLREMLDPSDVSRVLVEATPKSLAASLHSVLSEGAMPGRANHVRDDGDRALVVWHHIIKYHSSHTPSGDSTLMLSQPLVSVCIVTFNNPSTLKQALLSIEQQDYRNIEVVLVDDGSTHADAQQFLEEVELSFPVKGWKFLRQENRGPGAARNLAASVARGEYVMFMDDDNIAKPHEISTFVRVALHTKADAVTCANDYFYGQDSPEPTRVPAGRWVPLGAAKTVGLFQNFYGDTNSMLRSDVFSKIGGFPEDFGYALEDWELLSRVVLSNYTLKSVPEPLYWYRLRDTSHSRVTGKAGNTARTIRPYLKTIPRDLQHYVMFAQGMKESHDRAQKELQQERDSSSELQKMIKALASSIHHLCRDGHLSSESKNLVRNSHFEDNSGMGTPAAFWHPYGNGYFYDNHLGRQGRVPRVRDPSNLLREREGGFRDDDAEWTDDDKVGFGCIRMSNQNWRDSSGALQSIVLNQNTAAVVVVSGWSKAEKVSGSMDGGYSLYVDISFRDGSKQWGHTINFEPGSHGWQFKAGVIDPSIPIESIHLYAMFRWHSGTVWFDDLAVTYLAEGLCDYTQLTLEGLSRTTAIR